MARRRFTRLESKARTRAELLRAANRLFLRDGYAATSLGAIAEEAGLTKGAVYSNFESKEDLFLVVLQQATADGKWYAPDDVSAIEGVTPAERAVSFGRNVATIRPSRRHVALFLELNAAALRSERVRRWVADNNATFFESLGRALGDAIGVTVQDPAAFGLLAQSLYVGLMTHGAFDGRIDESTFELAYATLAAVAEHRATLE
jgi:AcrR family transcriptional regulator